jgi:hypothetical protein
MAVTKIKNKVNSIVKTVVYIALASILAIFVYILLIPRRYTSEHFQEAHTSNSSRSLYKSSQNYETDLNMFRPTLSDGDDMLIMKGCYQLPPNVRNMFPSACAKTTFSIYTSSFEEIRAKIISTLLEAKAKNNNQKLTDAHPIYVLVEQSPFMRDDKGNVLSMQYNVSSYGFHPVNLMRSGASVADNSRPLFYRITIYYTAYTQVVGNVAATPYNFDSSLARYRSKKDQCFISCQGDTTDTYCGCINRDVDKNDNKSYASKCSSTPLPVNGVVDTTKNVEADFVILFTLNTKAPIIISNNIFP